MRTTKTQQLANALCTVLWYTLGSKVPNAPSIDVYTCIFLRFSNKILSKQ